MNSARSSFAAFIVIAVFFAGCSLHRAAYEGDVAQVQSLLRTGADPNQEGGFYIPLNLTFDKEATDGPPIIYAAWMNHPDVIDVLIAGGAEVDRKDKLGDTALCWAITKKSEDAAIALLKHGADVNQTFGFDIPKSGLEKEPAILAACRKGLARVAAELVARGANLAGSDKYGSIRQCLQTHFPELQLPAQ